jgi:hypothetical protein
VNNAVSVRSISYRWALDSTGRPVPIEKARQGETYICPLCRGHMIPRLGKQVQHHFAHEDLTDCTPEAVARAAIRRWIVIQLREALSKHKSVDITWKCAKCGNSHTANLINGVNRGE